MFGCFQLLEKERDDENSEQGSTSSVPKPTHINDLPEEVLSSLFHRIPQAERPKLLRVCREWRELMDANIGISLRIGKVSEFDPKHDESGLKNCSPAILALVGISHLHVGHLSETWKADFEWSDWIARILRGNQVQPLPELKNPELLDCMSFYGKIPELHFSSLLDSVPHLRVLSICYFTIQHLSPLMLENLAKNLPSLGILTVRNGLKDSRQYQEADANWNLVRVRSCLKAILSNKFPRLDYASLDYVYESEEGLAITAEILRFLNAHVATLRNFRLDFCFLLAETWFQAELAVGAEAESEWVVQELIPLASGMKEQLQLQGFHILSSVINRLPHGNVWLELIEGQKGLTDWGVMGVCYELELLEEIVSRNWSTLVTILVWEVKLIDENTDEVKVLDCKIFSKCEALRKLNLQGFTVTLDSPNLQNARQLPKKLRELHFRDIAIPSTEIQEVLELPELQGLELRFVGNRGGMGMDLMVLKRVIRSRKLQWVKLFRSLNGKFPVEGVPNGDRERRGTRQGVIHEVKRGLIAFHMDESTGYFVNSPDED